MSERFNVLICKFYKFYICAMVGVIIKYFYQYFSQFLLFPMGVEIDQIVSHIILLST